MTIRIGILGFGNLGRGVAYAIRQNKDMALTCILTRRSPEAISPIPPNVPVYSVNDLEKNPEQLEKVKGMVDVLVICGGSATDLPVQTPEFVKHFNVIDSFDTHPCIPTHFANVDEAAKKSGHLALISCGWDPGMFSLMRLYGAAILTDGRDYTFWGKGVSQGHSDAIRRVKGVKNGKQYTIPVESALTAVRNGTLPNLSTREKHIRECFIVPEEGADLSAIENTIKSMPNYFADYDTTVHFISEEEFTRDHDGIPHGGFVFRSGTTGKNNEHRHLIEFNLKLDSNPEFTASVLLAFARAIHRLANEGATGCRTVFDIAPAYLSSLSGDELRKQLL